MKHKIILSRTYETEFIIDADDIEQAKIKFNELGETIYDQELQQCNVIKETRAVVLFSMETNVIKELF